MLHNAAIGSSPACVNSVPVKENSELTASLIPSRVVVIGVGLIGGSWARNLRSLSGVQHITGVGRSVSNLQDALDLGIIDDFQHEIDERLSDADLFIVATPIRSIEAVFLDIKKIMSRDAVVTDVGSVKEEVLETARRTFGNQVCRFVPGHPVAGTEKSGAAASFDTLFKNRLVLLTPDDDTNDDALTLVERLWREAGANVRLMDVKTHDAILARTSHLPHMLAYAIVGALGTDDETDRHFDLASGGFYDFTRIASSDAVMWRDICLSNPQAILSALRSFDQELANITEAIEASDGNWLLNYFDACRMKRNSAIERRSASDLQRKSEMEGKLDP